MSHLERGVKRRCASCDAPFYDMLRYPIRCPKCGAEFDATAGKKLASVPRPPKGQAARSGRPTAKAAAKAPEPEQPPEPKDDEAEDELEDEDLVDGEADDEDDDAEDDGDEDAEPGEDDGDDNVTGDQ